MPRHTDVSMTDGNISHLIDDGVVMRTYAHTADDPVVGPPQDCVIPG